MYLKSGHFEAPADAAAKINLPDDATGVLLQNRGPNSVWVGGESSVTEESGIELKPGAWMSIDIPPAADLYVLASAALQVAPNNLRWLTRTSMI